MPKIGEFKDGQKPNTMTGGIRTLQFGIDLRIEPVAERRSDDSPTHGVYGVGVDGELVEVGAAWSKMMEGNRRYLSVSIDDPSLSQPLSFAVFPASAPGRHDAVWTRREAA